MPRIPESVADRSWRLAHENLAPEHIVSDTDYKRFQRYQAALEAIALEVVRGDVNNIASIIDRADPALWPEFPDDETLADRVTRRSA